LIYSVGQAYRKGHPDAVVAWDTKETTILGTGWNWRYSGWCAADGVLSRRVSRDEDHTTYRFRQWDNGKVHEETVKPIAEVGTTKAIAGYSWSQVRTQHLISPHDCHIEDTNGLVSKFGVNNVVLLRRGDGLLAFSSRKKDDDNHEYLLSHFPKVGTQAPRAEADAREFELAFPFIQAVCVRYAEFAEKYFISPCSRQSNWKSKVPSIRDCIPYWWFDPKKRTLRRECPMRDGMNDNYFQLPWRFGMIRLVTSWYKIFDLSRGVYVLGKHGTEKILSAKIGGAQISPDGCKLAVRTRNDKLYVHELCKGK